MGLSSLFGGKDDPVTAWKKEMLAAVKSGDLEHFRFLLKREIEAPPEVLDEVLTKAVQSNLVKMTQAVLDTGGRRTLDSGVLRKLVYDNKTDMYRLLTDHGWDFVRAAPSGDGTQHYLRLERLMSKEYEVDRLKEELAATKKELADIRQQYGVPDDSKTAMRALRDDDPPPPRKLAP